MPKLTIQNESPYSMNFLQAGQMPLWLGPKSSLDITAMHFLLHEREIARACRSKREIDGMKRLICTGDDGAIGEVKPALISQAIREGHFGKEAQDYALDKDDPARIVAREEAAENAL